MTIKKLEIIATNDLFLQEFLSYQQTNAMRLFNELLLHENTDISSDIVIILRDIFEAEDLQHKSQVEIGKQLNHDYIIQLLKNLIDVSLQKWIQSQEEDEAIEENIFNILNIVENILELVPELVTKYLQIQNFLYEICKHKEILDCNLISSVEILSQIFSLMLSDKEKVEWDINPEHYKILLDLISKLAQYKQEDQKDQEIIEKENSDLQELFQNIIDILCVTLLLNYKQQQLFLEYEGNKKIVSILMNKSAKVSQVKAVMKLLSFSSQYENNVNDFIKIQGLKPFFKYFLKFVKGQKANQSLNESVLQSCWNLLKFSEQESKKRVLFKLKENKYQVLNFLVE